MREDMTMLPFHPFHVQLRIISRSFGYWLGTLLLLGGFLSSCSQSSSPSDTQPSSAVYVTADQNNLALMSWQRRGDTELEGVWITRSMPENNLPTLPAPSTTLMSGEIDQQTITLTVGGTVFEGKLESERLQLTGTDATGHFQTSIWYPLTQPQANQLSSAFDAYAQARLKLIILQTSLNSTPLPADSDPYAYAATVSSAASYVQDLQQKRDSMKQLGNPCGSGLLALFRTEYPPDPSTFTLSPYEKASHTADQNAQVTTANSTLTKQLQDVQSSWKQASTSAIPTIQGLSLSWKQTPDGKEALIQKATKALATLQKLLTTDYQSMTSLRQQAQTIGNDVKTLAQKYGC